MIGLIDVTSILVPRQLALQAHAHLREIGRGGLEGFALWAGAIDPIDKERFRVHHAIIPEQTGLRLESGVCVTVAAEELHRINIWLYENSMTLIAQLHTHPREAYHSETDDRFPIATTIGSLSLVIPNFAREPFSLRNCAIYRLMPDNIWRELTQVQVRELIYLTDE